MMIKRKNYQVPEPALSRLPWYLAFVKLLSRRGERVVSSTHISKSIGVDAALVAKDLSYISLSGKTRVGYDVKNMVEVLEDFLGFNERYKACLFGVGHFGASLITDRGLAQYGLDIVAAIDFSKDICGRVIGDLTVHHIDDAKEVLTPDIEIGILTVPVYNAQEVANIMIDQGIKAIWNFTPLRIAVPEGIVVQHTALYAHLGVLFNKIKERDSARD